MVRLRDFGGDFRAQGVAIDRGCLGDVAHRDGDVIETTDHAIPLVRPAAIIIPSTRARGTSAFCPNDRLPRRAPRGAPPPPPRRDRRGACAAATPAFPARRP